MTQKTMLLELKKRVLALIEEHERIQKDLEQALSENVCDVCFGTGIPESGHPCMCGGSGKMSEAALYLRESLVVANREISKLTDELERTWGILNQWAIPELRRKGVLVESIADAVSKRDIQILEDILEIKREEEG